MMMIQFLQFKLTKKQYGENKFQASKRYIVLSRLKPRQEITGDSKDILNESNSVPHRSLKAFTSVLSLDPPQTFFYNVGATTSMATSTDKPTGHENQWELCTLH